MRRRVEKPPSEFSGGGWGWLLEDAVLVGGEHSPFAGSQFSGPHHAEEWHGILDESAVVEVTDKVDVDAITCLQHGAVLHEDWDWAGDGVGAGHGGGAFRRRLWAGVRPRGGQPGRGEHMLGGRPDLVRSVVRCRRGVFSAWNAYGSPTAEAGRGRLEPEVLEVSVSSRAEWVWDGSFGRSRAGGTVRWAAVKSPGWCGSLGAAL